MLNLSFCIDMEFLKQSVVIGKHHFCNRTLGAFLATYHVAHKVSTGYQPQTNGQAEISNKEIKGILEKVVRLDKKDWSLRLDEALWAIGLHTRHL